MDSHLPLTFAVVDDLAFAATKGRLGQLPASTRFLAEDLGPALEVLQLQRGGMLPSTLPWIDFDELDWLVRALRDTAAREARRANGSVGMMRVPPQRDTAAWTGFVIRAKRAAQSAGLSGSWAAQMVAAMSEMEDNVHWHSGAAQTGVAAYRATPGRFEFVVADGGVGVLASLRDAAEYADLVDDGAALRLTLTEGASRFGSHSDRGHGFRPLFTGLANQRATLRFRSGEAAVSIDGRDPQLVMAQPATKPRLSGFLISVSCLVSHR